MGQINLDALLAQAKEVAPTKGQWFVPIPAPEADPFPKARPWEGFRPPPEQPLQAGRWLKDLANTLEKRVRAGAQYIVDNPDLPSAQFEKADRVLTQLSYQANLVARIAQRYTPCPGCPHRIGNTYMSVNPAMGEAEAFDFQEHFSEAEIPVTTPAGHALVLVPWRTGRSDRVELSPEDLAALARIGGLVGMDELTVYDRILQKEAT